MSPSNTPSNTPSSPTPPAPRARSVGSSASRGGRGALLVGAGILLSRLAGLVRERIFAHYLGTGLEAGAFKAAQRIPNVLQNLFGEGVLSGSFIPVYARLLGKGDPEEARRVASAVLGLLGVGVSLLVAGGVAAAPWLVAVVAPGFEGETRELTVLLVRITFPGVGMLVLSAWALAVLNSHRRFFLSYVAPVLWNGSLIAALVAFGGRPRDELVIAASWGAVFGSFLQLAVQLPTVRKLLGALRPTLTRGSAHVREVVRNFGPVVLGRGVVQISAYVDTAVASLISARAMSALVYAQTLYLIPVSLFGMAVTAAELPELARASGDGEGASERILERLTAARRRMGFFVVASAGGLLFAGDAAAATLLQTGAFGAADSRYVWYLLMGATVGLNASTVGRLYGSAFYALGLPRVPFATATVRVVLSAALAFGVALQLPDWLGWPHELAAAFLTLASALAAHVETVLLRRRLAHALQRPLKKEPLHRLKLWGSAALAGGAALGLKGLLVARSGAAAGLTESFGGHLLPAPALTPWVWGPLVLGAYGLVYVASTLVLGVPEPRALLSGVIRRLRRR